MTNDLILRVLNGEPVERPPVWLMRQAGRILPQYRKIRSSLSGFKELVETPDLAAEVTIQPVDELGVDAAIIFSDILVIPEAMGLPYELIEKKGPLFPRTIESAQDIQQLISGEKAAQELAYVYQAIKATKKALNGRVPLIGFSGAPWTLLSYMIEGSGSKTFSKAKRFLYRHPQASHKLLQKITETTIAYLKQKIKAGVDVVQVFDSWAGILSQEQYRTFALPYINQICNEITEVPVIVFAKGAWHILPDLAQVNCSAIGLDWTHRPEQAKAQTNGQKVLQGNLDPCQLYGPLDQIAEATHQMIKAYGGKHIVNLGHGVYPDTPLDGVKRFVEAAQAYRY